VFDSYQDDFDGSSIVCQDEAMTENEVNIPTPDGIADCYFVHPPTGAAPAIVMWTDIYGLRAAFRQMANRLAESGYAVLAVNPFYRVMKAPTAEHGTATPVEQVRPISEHLSEKTHLTDARAFTEWLDLQPSVAKDRKMGAIGYCFGGQLAFRTAIARPDRVAAVACCHGGRLVTDKPNSPHLQAGRMPAQFLIAIARNDDEKAPDTKDTLRAALPAAEIEVYPAQHGWCVLDSKVYNETQAEKAWARVLALFRKSLSATTAD
jgi:carboxymethylenebutenolidase